MDYIIGDSLDGKKLLDALRRDLNISMATVRHLKFIEGGIRVNGEHATVRRVLRKGDTLSLAFEDEESSEKISPTPIDLRVVFEDSELTVPDKPADMPTHPSFGHYTDTVANALAYRYRGEGSFVFRPVNRLDRNTSGLLLIARNRVSAARLSDSMRRGDFEKIYIAILDGRLPDDFGIVDTHMTRTADSIIVRRVCAPEEGGDRAVTLYSVIARSDSHTLVCAIPKTGRTHQLRVHFAHLGCPITGDDLYGTPDPRMPRHALHSYSLSFPHPTDGRQMTFRAPLPEDMASFAERVFDPPTLGLLRDIGKEGTTLGCEERLASLSDTAETKIKNKNNL